MTSAFSKWARWNERSSLSNLEFPGVYAIAISEHDTISEYDISGRPFSWCREIVYIGMTNSKGGLKSRLRQFDNTIKGERENHGGAQRVRFKHPDYNNLVPNLYVSVCPRRCDVQSNDPKDLRIMGEVARLEYVSFACYVDAFHRLPEFNDKKRSPKR
jgi:hypothetical protein